MTIYHPGTGLSRRTAANRMSALPLKSVKKLAKYKFMIIFNLCFFVVY
jgi:hypothetical protein